MNIARITYSQRPDASPESEITTLANVYQFLINRANTNATGVTSTSGDDAKERSMDDSSATQNCTA
jgi:hypothetical protein